VRSKARVWGRLICGITGSNPAEGTAARPRVCCLLRRQRPLRRADHCYREGLLGVSAYDPESLTEPEMGCSVTGKKGSVKVKVSMFKPRRQIGGAEVERHSFLTWALDGGEWATSSSGRFIPQVNNPVPRQQIGGAEVQRHSFLTWAPNGGEWATSRPSRFIPQANNPSSH